MNRKVVSFIGILIAAVGVISLGLYFTRGSDETPAEKPVDPQVAEAPVQKPTPSSRPNPTPTRTLRSSRNSTS